MAIWMNNTAMQLLTKHRLTGATLTESDIINRHINLQRARVVMAPINKESSSVRVSATSGFKTKVKCEDIKPEWRNPKNVTAVILGGGAGSRLLPLTQKRAKPAVPLGGTHRLIDVPISNCLNSQIKKVYIMTQYNSASLNRHITNAYNVSGNAAVGDGFIEVLAATQTPGEGGSNWFQGTADAVRQFAWLLEDAKAKAIDDILILSGDHLYQMDYMEFLQSHRASGADITISCVPMDDRRASDFGLMKINSTGRIVSFSEKPKGDELKLMRVDTTVLGLSRQEAEEKQYIASMGIYAFKKDVLLNLLRNQFPGANDFGSEIIPQAAREFLVKAYLFKGYWEDIGTIRSFYEANLALTDEKPGFNFYDQDNPMFTSRMWLPPSMINDSKVKDAIVSHGCILDCCYIERSILGVQSHICPNVRMKDTVMFGADFSEGDDERLTLLSNGKVPLGVGPNTLISNCIIDKNARIGRNVIIANSQGVIEADRSSDGYYIRDGIVVIPKDVTIREGMII